MINNGAADIHTTEDGSITLKDEGTGELYHNRAGAYTEALTNFVEPLNLNALSGKNEQLAFLDVCFGLGYNTFVLLSELSRLDLRADSIAIVGIEKFQKPLLYIGEVIADQRFAQLHDRITAQAPGFARGEFGSFNFSLPCRNRDVRVSFELWQGDLRQMVPRMVTTQSGRFDGIFHDPFSARRAPELWTIDLFECYKQLLSFPSGRVVTYSSASAVRGAFKQSGLTVRRTPAVGGKSGGTLVMLSSAGDEACDGFPLLDTEEEKLAGRAGVPYRDRQFCKSSKEIVRDREQEQKLLFPL